MDTTLFPLKSRKTCPGFSCILLDPPVGSRWFCRWFCLYLPGISETENGEWDQGIENATRELIYSSRFPFVTGNIHSFIYSFWYPLGKILNCYNLGECLKDKWSKTERLYCGRLRGWTERQRQRSRMNMKSLCIRLMWKKSVGAWVEPMKTEKHSWVICFPLEGL